MDRNVSLYPTEFGEAPLSHAFREARLEWREIWERFEESKHADDKGSELLAEAATLAVRRLWRRAFSLVGEPGSNQAKAMVYAFVALLDEQLLFEEWSGRLAWQQRPLENRLYGTRNAGDRIPRAIYKLLKERAPASRDLANVYLQCLVLGFYGGLRNDRGRTLHARWKHALFCFAWQREPTQAGVVNSLTRPSQVPALRLPVRRELPGSTRLCLAILGVLVLLTAAGHLMWRDIQAQLDPLQYPLGFDEDGRLSR